MTGSEEQATPAIQPSEPTSPSGPSSLLLRAYRAGTPLLQPLAAPFLRRRLRRGKEDAARLPEREGRSALPRPAGPLVWLHGASVGEGLALLGLIEALRERGFNILVTTGTVTSAALMAERLPAGVIHQFIPLDVPAFMRRFLRHWRPDLVVLAESELWPNLVSEIGDRKIPLVLVNARMSDRSFARWRRMPGLIHGLLGPVSLCLVQSARDADRYAALGADRPIITGNLKFDAVPLPADPAKLADLRARLGQRPTWLAASTHAEEEPLLIEAHRRLLDRYPNLLTLLIPRHISRGAVIAEQARAAGISTQLRSAAQGPDAGTSLYVADTMGETGLFYRACPLVLVGKSLAGGGGQNPIEPARLGCAILHGPMVGNFIETYAALDDGGGAVTVSGAAGLAEQVGALLADKARLDQMAASALNVVEGLGGATDRSLAAMEPFCANILARYRA